MLWLNNALVGEPNGSVVSRMKFQCGSEMRFTLSPILG